MVHASSGIPLHLQVRRRERPLLSDQNVKVVVGGVYTSMSLRAKRGPEDDEVLGDARVDDVHRAHGTPGVAEYPFSMVGVQSDLGGRVRLGEVGKDILSHEGRVIRVWRGSDGSLCQLV